MSLSLTEAVWQIPFTDPTATVGRPSLKLAMLALAYHADEEGNVEGVRREELLRIAEMNRSYWQRVLHILEEQHWLDRVPPYNHGGPNRTTTYLLDATRLRQWAAVAAEVA